MEGTSSGSAAEKELGRAMERGKPRVSSAHAPWESAGWGLVRGAPGLGSGSRI